MDLQAAYLMKFPDQIGTLYYNAIPHKLFWPTFVVALLAAIVASQAIITGTQPGLPKNPCVFASIAGMHSTLGLL